MSLLFSKFKKCFVSSMFTIRDCNCLNFIPFLIFFELNPKRPCFLNFSNLFFEHVNWNLKALLCRIRYRNKPNRLKFHCQLTSKFIGESHFSKLSFATSKMKSTRLDISPWLYLSKEWDEGSKCSSFTMVIFIRQTWKSKKKNGPCIF